MRLAILFLTFFVCCQSAWVQKAWTQDDDGFASWSDRSGQFQIEAKFLRLADDVVYLEDRDGEFLEVDLDQLDVASRVRAQKLAIVARGEGRAASGTTKTPRRAEMQDDSDEEAETRQRNADKPRLLKLTGFNLQKLDPANEKPRWNVVPDTFTAETAMTEQGLRFTGKKEFSDRVSGSAISIRAGKAMFGYTKFSSFQGSGTTCIEIDLVAGEKLREIVFNQRLKPLCLSDDGLTLMTVIDGFGAGRSAELAAWDISGDEPRPIWACRPFIAARGFHDKDVAWAAFLPKNQVAVMSASNEIGVFKTSSGTCTHRIISLSGKDASRAGGRCVPALSVNRKYLAACNGRALAIYDTTSLKPVGMTELRFGIEPKQLSFTPDGRELLIMTEDRFLSVDIGTGETVVDCATFSRFVPGSHTFAVPLVKANENLYLVGDTLVDSSLEIPLWTFEDLESAHQRGQQTLLAFRSSHGVDRDNFAAAMSLPHEAITRALNRLRDRPDLYALSPGDNVEIDVSELSGASQKNEAIASILKWAHKNNVAAVTSSNRVLKATMTAGEQKTVTFYEESDPFASLPTFGSFGDRKGTPVTYTPYSAKLTLTVDGDEVWSNGWSFDSYYVTRTESQSVQAAVLESRRPRYHVYGLMLPKGRVLKQDYIDGVIGTSKPGASGLTHRIKSSLAR